MQGSGDHSVLRGPGVVLALTVLVVGVLGMMPPPASATTTTGCSAPHASTRAAVGRHLLLGIQRPERTLHASCPSGSATSSSATGSSATGTPPPAPGYSGTPPLLYNGGVVLGTAGTVGEVTITPIFWAPAGYSFSASYQSVVDGFLANVAAASGQATNAFANDTQYSGPTGADIQYDIHVGAAISDTTAFPATASCTPDTGPIYSDSTGYTACLTDAQIQSQLTAVLAAQGLPSDLGHLYAVFLPKGVESCITTANGAGGGQCTINASTASAGSFCAYHSATTTGPAVYADMPFPIYSSLTGFTCSPQGSYVGANESPNGNLDADVEVSLLSHETNEAITDPEGSAWYDSSGNEIADDCAYVYGNTATFGGSAGAYYNQTINGGHYFLQEEFSNQSYATNAADACVQQPTPALTSLSPTSAGAGTVVSVTGANFGSTQGTSYVRFVDSGTSWGAPGNAASFSVDSWSDSSVTFTVPAPSGSTGQWAVIPGTIASVTVSTAAGGTSAPASLSITASTTLPSITSLSPTSAPAGTVVSVTGANFGSTQGTSYVRFVDSGTSWGAPGNAASFSVDSWSDSSVTFTVPAPSGSTGQWAVIPGTIASVTVSTAAGGTSAPASLSITASTTLPSITSLSPTSAPAGTVVSVTGANFGSTQGTSYVRFVDSGTSWGAPGNAASFSVDSWSDSSVTFTVPAPSGSTGQWAVIPGTIASVTVSTAAGGTSAPASLSITASTTLPSITSLSPTSAPAGTVVSVTGANFGSTQGTSYVRFVDSGTSWGAPGNAASFSVDSWSDSSVTFTVPAPSGSTGQWAVIPGTIASVTVSTAAGGTSAPASLSITASTTLPSITSLSPTSAPAGTVVSVTGANFGSTQGTSYVRFVDSGTSWGAPGNAASFSVDSWSDSSVTFTVPAPSGSTGQWAVIPGTIASVTVSTAAGGTSAPASLSIT